MAASALAQHPGMTETLTAITRLLVLLFLVSSMSGIGLGLTLSQIIAPLRNVKLIVLAVIMNFIIVPLLAVVTARLLRLDEPFALGLLLLGLAAGAPFLPKVVGIANGDVASAVGLMVLLMVGTTVFLPVALPLLIKGVQVNPWKIARFLTLLMLIPLVAGLIVRARAASIGARVQTRLRRSVYRHPASGACPGHGHSFSRRAPHFRHGRHLCRPALCHLLGGGGMVGWWAGIGPKDGPWLGDRTSQHPRRAGRERAKLQGSKCVGDGSSHHAYRDPHLVAGRAPDRKAPGRYTFGKQSHRQQLSCHRTHQSRQYASPS